MLTNLERRKSFLEYREMYLQIIKSGLHIYAKTKDEAVLAEIKKLGQIYKEVEKGYSS